MNIVSASMVKRGRKGNDVGEGSGQGQVSSLKRAKGTCGNVNDSFPKLVTHSTTMLFVESMKALNRQQKRSVVEIGFGTLLEVKIDKFPSRMMYWLVNSFHPASCELVLNGGRSLSCGVKDIERVLGFPNGNIPIVKKTKSDTGELYYQWRDYFEPTASGAYKIKVEVAHQRMMDESDGGPWFKRHFIALVDCCIIGNVMSGYVNPLIMKSLEDVGNIRNLNWCEYTLDTLISNRMKWDTSKKKEFNGPLLFLLGLYMDRVVVCNHHVPRRLPSVLALSTELAAERCRTEMRLGGFGQGSIVDPLGEGPSEVREGPSEVREAPSEGRDVPLEVPGATGVDVHGASLQDGGMQGYVGRVLAKLARVASDVVDIISMVKDASREIAADPGFPRIEAVARNMICEKVSKGSNEKASELGDTQSDDAFWNNPENIEALEKVENVVLQREEFKKWFDDAPSFSMGFSQDFADPVWGSVLETTRHYQEENIGGEKEKVGDVDDRVNVGEMAVREADVAAGVGGTTVVEGETVDSTAVAEGGEKATDVAAGVGGTVGAKGEIPDLTVVVEGGDKVIDETEATDINEGGGKTKNEVGTSRGRGRTKVCARKSQRKPRKTEVLTSPFNRRQIDVAVKLNKHHNMIAKWVFENPDEDKDEVKNEVIFKVGDRLLYRDEFKSMRPGRYVSVVVLDVWSVILNSKEKVKAVGSPSRFFATTYCTLFTVVMPSKEHDEEGLLALFSRNFDAEFPEANSVRLQAVDMFFFPICKSEHIYVICYDIKRRFVHILDNSSVGGTDLAKYEDTPAWLTALFSKYLLARGCYQSAWVVENSVVSRVAMPWRDEENKIDCGVFAMRHMETYMGGGTRNWDAGLEKGNTALLNKLRTLYCAAIVEDDVNEVKETALTEAKKFSTGKKKA